MKKTAIYRSMAVALCALAVTTLSSCLSDGDETVALENGTSGGNNDYTLRDDYFTIEGAEWQSGGRPEATINDNLSDDGSVTYNQYGLQGGMNYISFYSTKVYKYLLVGVKGVSGYWRYTPHPTSVGNRYFYQVPIYYTTRYSKNIIIWIIAVTSDGGYGKPYETGTIIYEKDGISGDNNLNINLTFDTPKDVDLHLVTPSGAHIYYGNRTGGMSTSKDLLDHDSNADCDIDNLNNENIIIPSNLVEAGTYHVYVDLYKNCNTSFATNWTVVARYKGQTLSNQLSSGRNPVAGTFAAGAASSYSKNLTEVIRFTLTQSQVSTRAGEVANLPRVPYQPTDKDLLKMYLSEIGGEE